MKSDDEKLYNISLIVGVSLWFIIFGVGSYYFKPIFSKLKEVKNEAEKVFEAENSKRANVSFHLRVSKIYFKKIIYFSF